LEQNSKVERYRYFFCEISRILRIPQELDIAYKQVTLQNIKKEGIRIGGSYMLSEEANMRRSAPRPFIYLEVE
jgi:hypothetical protein